MIVELPAYVSIVYILTTFASIGFLLQCVKTAGLNSLAAKILLYILPLWLIFQGVLGQAGFYQETETSPPRIA